MKHVPTEPKNHLGKQEAAPEQTPQELLNEAGEAPDKSALPNFQQLLDPETKKLLDSIPDISDSIEKILPNRAKRNPSGIAH